MEMNYNLTIDEENTHMTSRNIKYPTDVVWFGIKKTKYHHLLV